MSIIYFIELISLATTELFSYETYTDFPDLTQRADCVITSWESLRIGLLTMDM